MELSMMRCSGSELKGSRASHGWSTPLLQCLLLGTFDLMAVRLPRLADRLVDPTPSSAIPAQIDRADLTEISFKILKKAVTAKI